MFITFRYLLLLTCLFLVFSCKNEMSTIDATQKPNVLFIIADDLNCDLGTYGHPMVQSPYMDKLAATGLVFENAHCQYPLCGPSRASLMTGLYADQTKIKQNRIYVRQTVPDVVTLGQKFREVGYNAVRIGKIYHYDNPGSIGTSSFDDVYTWDYVFNPYGKDKEEEHKIEGIVKNWNGGDLSWHATDATDSELTDGIGAQLAVDELKKFAKNGENFFLAFGLYRPHVPFVAPKKYFDLYDLADFQVPESSNDYLKTIPKPAAISVRSKKEQVYLDKKLSKTIKRAYYATTSFMDAQIGRVLDKLKATGLDKNTIIVFTSDHGYHLGEHGHWQKQTLFNDATRVPLIIAGPGIPKNKKIEKSPVELVDLYPTLMDLVDITTPKFVQGKSLVPLLQNSENKVRKSALTELQVKTKNGIAQGYSIKTKRYRLSRWKHLGEKIILFKKFVWAPLMFQKILVKKHNTQKQRIIM